MMTFTQKLREQNLKVTPQRLAMLEEINSAGHIDVDALYEILKIKFPTLALATIYKNVSQMYELSILEVIKVPDRKLQYEITKAPHIHLACDSCGSVMDMNQCIDELMFSAESESGYKLNHSTVVLNGLCPKCQSI